MRKFAIGFVIVIILAIGGYVGYRQLHTTTSDEASIGTTSDQPEATTQPSSFNKEQYSLHDPTSIWVIVNKQNAIPVDFEPDLVVPNVRLRLAASEQQMHISSAIEPAIQELFAAAKTDSVTLVFGSGYRSAALQRQFYNSYVAKSGQAAADTYSARPGHSEHQTGLALDVTSPSGTCHLEICWQNTPEGKWIAANAHKYGFVIRYPEGKESITGYQYEPWHIRYVGKELSTEIQKTGQTLEEFFELGPANSYD